MSQHSGVESGGNVSIVMDRLQRLDNTLFYGNGKPGLCTRMETVENTMERLLKVQEKKEIRQSRIEAAVWAGVLLTILNLIASHVKL